MKRILVAVFALLFAGAAFAACDITFALAVTYKGEKVWTNPGVTWHGVPDAQAAKMYTDSLDVVKVANHFAGKDGGYSATFGESQVCDGVKKDAPPFTASGLTIQGVDKVMDASDKVIAGFRKMGKDAMNKGKQRAWGKE